MKIVNGKIAEATENEIFDYYLSRDWDTVMSFREWMMECEAQERQQQNEEHQKSPQEYGEAKV